MHTAGKLKAAADAQTTYMCRHAVGLAPAFPSLTEGVFIVDLLLQDSILHQLACGALAQGRLCRAAGLWLADTGAISAVSGTGTGPANLQWCCCYAV